MSEKKNDVNEKETMVAEQETNVTEDKAAKLSPEDQVDIVDFDEVHSTKGKDSKDKPHDEKMEQNSKENNEKTSESEEKKETEKTFKGSEKEETEKEETGKSFKGKQKTKDDLRQESENDSQDKEKSEKDAKQESEKVSEGKQDSKEDIEQKSEKASEGKQDSKEDIEQKSEKVSEGKQDSKEDFKQDSQKASEDDKKSEDMLKENEKKESEVKKNSAISQSKRLADAKPANKAVEEKNNQSRSKKALWITLGIVAGLFLIAYISGFVYFSGHFYQDVAINGINISNMDKTAAKNALDNFYKDYKLTLITIDDDDVIIDGKDISMQVSLHDEFDSCLQKQQPYIWFVKMFNHHDFEIEADASWDETALSEVYDSMDILNKKLMILPEDAYVGVEDGKFVIVKEIMGTTIKTEEFKKNVEESLSRVQSTLDLVETGCYDVPQVYDTDEDLKKELNAKNEYAENEIKIKLDDLTLEPGMELYNDVLEKSGDSYKVSKSKVETYVKKLAEEYDTLGIERTFTTSFSSKKVEVLGEAFGYELNQEETIDVLYKALTAGKSATVEAVFNSKGITLQGENDIGNTYIEVNLSEQRVIAYKDGKKVAEGNCVSGNESAGHGTCIGLYAIQGKQSPAVLRGEKVPKTKTVTKKKKNGKTVKVQETTMEYEYESPVTFWMPFNGGIGLHDASGWRSQYGGSIYYYSGSHGCVNLPYDLAQTLYENFEIGDPVIVYFWDNENRK